MPPALAVAANGFLMSREEWEKVETLRRDGGLRKLIKGGWRDVPEIERWWEEQYRGIGERLSRNLEQFEKMKSGVEAIGDL